jgi:2,4'-dihydroxyacetophenone dioxygenase
MKPFATAALDWIPIVEGLSFKPITYFPDDTGWQLLLRLEPGTVVPPHRHTGEVHAFNLSGSRLLINTGEEIGPGTYVYEPAGNRDTWKAIGDQPCIVHVEVNGRIEYLDERGAVTRVSDARASRELYRRWCAEHGTPPAF